jgi:hypothetical protein
LKWLLNCVLARQRRRFVAFQSVVEINDRRREFVVLRTETDDGQVWLLVFDGFLQPLT